MQNEINEKISTSNKIINTANTKLPSSLTDIEDKCKIYLAEIFTLNKRIEKLNSELEEKTKNEKDLNKKVNELETISNQKLNQHITLIDEQKFQIEKIQSEIEILKAKHDHKELIDFYEIKIKEIEDKNKNTFKFFSKFCDKLSTKSTNPTISNRDEVWRNLIKKYETKFTELETEIEECKNKERKNFLRQKFFEKYCFKAEEKIEEISKISKKFYDQENLITNLKNELESLHKEFKDKQNLINEINSENLKFKKENEELKIFYNKINPILKIDWEEIKKTNEEVFIRNVETEVLDLNKTNIIVLIETLNQFILVFRETISEKFSTDINIDNISQIIEDIKKYTIILLEKIQTMSINQFYIINTCCDINDKLKDYARKNKAGLEFLKVLKDIKSSCAKLLIG